MSEPRSPEEGAAEFAGRSVRLLVCDIDGCLSHPFRPPEWPALAEIARLHMCRDTVPYIPALTLCTGRPLPYAEAVAQWLGVSVPLLFESGSGMYDPSSNQVRWSPAIDAATEAALARLRPLIHDQLVDEYPGTRAEFGKGRDVGFNHPDPTIIEDLRERVLALVEEHRGDGALEVHHTEISVNVIPAAANKGSGLRWLSQHLELPLSQIAYIGDSGGDLSALSCVGRPFAPANAIAEIRRRPEVTVTSGEATGGVLEAYEQLIAYNRMVYDDEFSTNQHSDPAPPGHPTFE
ncbi:HAD family hydrolase [Haliangium ochraceum]|uniref:HAD-superfamily hydrolase, subfamily IIB n=1 Tax=Haliangium ochraceum (strain DSM 14365 / JCM 11303 / SMP-2) TaxID=502025 RepID=D0LYG1_HALO1|nr:HAD family hydrolase [Haliangium ochraceum]ACY17827.1 HAD-superfamily hydrolase, subfamily IIB [Haliangium ochraceum DSM 14365]